MVYQNSKRLNGTFVCRLFLAAAVFPLLASCVSKPPVLKPETFYQGRSGFALMAEGADLYISAEVQSVRPILDSLALGGMTGAELKDFLDMSKVLTAAVFPSAGGRHFYAAASGNFPSGRGGLFFNTSKDWETKLSASGMPYWYSERSRLSVSLGAKDAYLSDTDPFVPPPGAQIPEALPALQKGAVLYGWMNDPAQALKRIVASFGVPIEIPASRIVFAVYPAETEAAKKSNKADEGAQYSAVLRFETPSASQANALVRIFSLARLGLAFADFSQNKDMEMLVKAFFSQNPTADGSALILATGVMKGSDLALLFNMMSVQ